MPWFHGTPDVRALRESGGFTPRSENRRIVSDLPGLRAAKEHASEPGISDAEAMRRLGALDRFFSYEPVPVPVFLSACRDTAATYADDRRAWDYQNADPAVLEVGINAEADLVIDAGRETFRGLRWPPIEAGLRKAGADPEDVRSLLEDRLQKPADGPIRVSDLGAALHLAGFAVVEVRNVIDTHTGRGKPDTVRMVFDMSLLEVPALAKPLEPAGP